MSILRASWCFRLHHFCSMVVLGEIGTPILCSGGLFYMFSANYHDPVLRSPYHAFTLAAACWSKDWTWVVWLGCCYSALMILYEIHRVSRYRLWYFVRSLVRMSFAADLLGFLILVESIHWLPAHLWLAVAVRSIVVGSIAVGVSSTIAPPPLTVAPDMDPSTTIFWMNYVGAFYGQFAFWSLLPLTIGLRVDVPNSSGCFELLKFFRSRQYDLDLCIDHVMSRKSTFSSPKQHWTTQLCLKMLPKWIMDARHKLSSFGIQLSDSRVLLICLLPITSTPLMVGSSLLLFWDLSCFSVCLRIAWIVSSCIAVAEFKKNIEMLQIASTFGLFSTTIDTNAVDQVINEYNVKLAAEQRQAIALSLSISTQRMLGNNPLQPSISQLIPSICLFAGSAKKEHGDEKHK